MENEHEYNGHPSYEHWNVALWVANDEVLYDYARRFSTPYGFAHFLQRILSHTPDGVEITPELAEYAWLELDGVTS